MILIDNHLNDVIRDRKFITNHEYYQLICPLWENTIFHNAIFPTIVTIVII